MHFNMQPGGAADWTGNFQIQIIIVQPIPLIKMTIYSYVPKMDFLLLRAT